MDLNDIPDFPRPLNKTEFIWWEKKIYTDDLDLDLDLGEPKKVELKKDIVFGSNFKRIIDLNKNKRRLF